MKTFTLFSTAFAASAVLLASCGGRPGPMASAKEYATMKIDTTSKTVEKSYSANIRGRQDIDIYPQISGRITKVCVTEGQKVRKGDILFIIDQVPYISALKTAEANVEAAKAGVATAQLTYDSNVKLFDEKVISEYELLSAENALLTAKAALAQSEAQEVNARNNLSYTTVSSPANGVVGTIPYREGTLVSSAIPQPMTTISDNSSMYVYFSFNETQLLSLLKEYGSPEKMMTGMQNLKLQLSDGSIYGSNGYLESVSGVIDKATGAVSLRAVFPNEDRILHSGASGKIIVPTEYRGCIAIPQSATTELQDRILVFKVQDGIANSAPVTVITGENGNEYIVTSGLSAGEVIITEGVGFLKDGTPVGSSSSQPAEETK